jgi:hypothetical protein
VKWRSTSGAQDMRQERLDTVFACDRDFVTVGYRLQG